MDIPSSIHIYSIDQAEYEILCGLLVDAPGCFNILHKINATALSIILLYIY